MAALDAWQSGRLNDLKTQSPPIAFSDDDVVQGNALVSYDLDPSLEIAPQKDVQVKLIVRNRSGASQHRTATYQVVLKPNAAVIRNE